MRPVRFVGRRYLVEERPFSLGVTNLFRGVDPTSLERVVVVEPSVYLRQDEQELFALAGQWFASLGPVAPELRHVLGTAGTPAAYVIEDVEGLTLEDMLASLRERREFLPVDIAQAIVRELVDLVRAPVMLRFGIKEVLIAPDGRVRAKPRLEPLEARQTVGAALLVVEPQVGYLSPEVVRGHARSFASEMFTLGVILYELIANRHPFISGDRETTMFEILTRVKRALPPPIQAFRRDVPAQVAAFLDRALAPQPSHRFGSWDEFLAELPARSPAEILAAMPVPPEREPPYVIPSLEGVTADDLTVLPLPPRMARVPEVLPPRIPASSRGSTRYGRDRRPMIRAGNLYIDVTPVTCAEYQRFILATEGPDALDPTADWNLQTAISIDDARRYARWAGKRLPTDDEWEAAMAQHANTLYDPYRAVWEWTTSPVEDGGYVVRGGRWRDAVDRLPQIGNRSYETGPADDVGFRCVEDA